MPIGSVSAAGLSTAYAGLTSARTANATALAKLQQDADDRAQLEYLAQHLHALKDALATLREHWRRSDEAVPASAARAVSQAVLAAPGDEDLPLRDLEGFAGVAAGTLTVNGIAVAFDPAGDSLADLAARIGAAGAGVTAALDDAGERLVITSTDAAADLSLDDGGAGLLDALGLAAGSRGPASSGHTPGMSWSRAGKVADALGDAVAAINAIFAEDTPGGEPSSVLVRARGDLQKAVEDAFGADTTNLARDLGFTQDFSVETGDVMDFGARTARELVRALRNRPAAAEVMLFGEAKDDRDGLIGHLDLRVGVIEKRLQSTFSTRGLSFDLYA